MPHECSVFTPQTKRGPQVRPIQGMLLGKGLPDASRNQWENGLPLMDRPFSNSRADLAGKIIARRITSPAITHQEAFIMVVKWRTFHAHALRDIANLLKERAVRIDPTVTTAQRLKRLESIRRKLVRSKTCALTQMQDIGGCRAVVETIGHVFQLKQLYERYAEVGPATGPALIATSTRDYLLKPKKTGIEVYILCFATEPLRRLVCIATVCG